MRVSWNYALLLAGAVETFVTCANAVKNAPFKYERLNKNDSVSVLAPNFPQVN